MGWTSMHRDKGLTNDEFFRAEFPTMLDERGEILASATVRGTYYAAVRQRDTGEVWALVVLVRWNRGSFNFIYKEMSETQGPSEDGCPAKVLDLLTETDSEWANEWRARCRAKLAKPKPAKGQRVRFQRELHFPNGTVADTFIFEGRNTFWGVGAHSYMRFSIPDWRDAAYELISY